MDKLPIHSDYLKKARVLVIESGSASIATDEETLPLEAKDLYVVWFAKTLQNWKALVSTDKADGLYWEVTYDGDKEQAYVDTYAKQDNVAYKDEWFNDIVDFQI